MKQKEHIEDLEPHQYKNIYASDDVPFEDISTGLVKRLVYYGIGLFLVLLILSFFIKIPREIHIPFVLKGGLNEVIYQLPEQVYIHKFYKNPSDIVSTGDTLAAISSEKIVRYIEEYKNALAELNLQQEAKQKVNERKTERLISKEAGLEKELLKYQNLWAATNRAKENEKANLELQVVNTERQHERNKLLHEQKVISDAELEASLINLQIKKQSLISKTEEYNLQLSALEGDIQKITNELAQISIEIDEYKAEFEYELAALQKSVATAENNIFLNYGPFAVKDNTLLLLSKAKGKITLRSENEYECPPNEILLRITTDSINYYAYAEAETKDIGFVKKGTRVILKYKTFPHYYYGTMKASVLSVSESPAENGAFPVKLKITEQGRLQHKITKGMTGTASFVVEDNTVIQYLLKAFLKVVTIDETKSQKEIEVQ